jgi:MEMO1 family protein
MQYPYIYKVLQDMKHHDKNHNNTIYYVTSIMCGSLTSHEENIYGQLLSEIISRSNVLTIVSTDFCHWGSRFSYQPIPTSSSSITRSDSSSNSSKPNQCYDQNTTTNPDSNVALYCQPIYEHIESIDYEGIHHIVSQQPEQFSQYLKRTKNTICGRHAISVYLQAITTSNSTSATTSTNNTAATTIETQNSSNSISSLQIELLKYNQSSKVTSLHDSSVSYVAARCVFQITSSAATLNENCP